MKLRLFIVTLAAFFVAGLSSMNAQIYHHKAGGSLLFGDYGVGPVVHYGARINVSEPNEDMSISLNADPGIFFEGEFNSRFGGGGFLIYDLPVYASLNLGGYSTWLSKKYFGGFVGLGYEFSNWTYTANSDLGHGPMVIGGVRVLISDNSFEFAGSYMLGSDDTPGLLGIRASWLIGDY